MSHQILRNKIILLFLTFNSLIFLIQSIKIPIGISLNTYLSLFSIDQPQFRPWQVFTYAFIHANFFHFFFNMLGIFFLGMQVEKTLGSRIILLLMLLSGGLTGITYVILFKKFILIGASAITYGLLTTFAYLYPRKKLAIFGIIPVESRFIVIGLLIFDFMSPIINTQHIKIGNIAHFAHIIGATISFCFLELKYKKYLNY